MVKIKVRSFSASWLYRPRLGAHVITILTMLIAQFSSSNLPIRLINAGIPAPLTEDISRYSLSILAQSALSVFVSIFVRTIKSFRLDTEECI